MLWVVVVVFVVTFVAFVAIVVVVVALMVVVVAVVVVVVVAVVVDHCRGRQSSAVVTVASVVAAVNVVAVVVIVVVAVEVVVVRAVVVAFVVVGVGVVWPEGGSGFASGRQAPNSRSPQAPGRHTHRRPRPWQMPLAQRPVHHVSLFVDQKLTLFD